MRQGKIIKYINGNQINIPLSKLPRERFDLWDIRLDDNFDKFVSSIYYTKEDGLYLRFTKSKIVNKFKSGITFEQIDETELLELLDQLNDTPSKRIIKVLGLSSYGIAISSKKLTWNQYKLISDTESELIIKFNITSIG